MATNLTQRGPNATAPARLPGIQTSRVEDPNTRQALDALREWVEVRLGSRGDFWERALTHREYKLDMDALKLLIDELQRQINALLADRGPGSGTGVTAAEFAAFRSYVLSELATLGKCCEPPVTGEVPLVIRQGVGYAAGTSTARNTPPTGLFDPNSWTPAGDPYWSNVIFLNKFNGTNGATLSGGDESVYNQSFVGFSRYTTTSPIEGTAWVNCTTEYSNPSDSYSTGAEGAIGTGDWTFEIILDADATQGGFALIMGGGNNTGYFFANGYGLILQNSTPPNNLGLWIYNYSAVGPLLKSTTDLRGAGPTAVAVSKIGSTWRLFINGVVEDTQTWAGSIDGGINRTRYMRGHGNGGVIDRYLGKYDAVRETVGVGRYASNYAPPWVFGVGSPPLDVLLNLQFDGANGATTTTDASFNAYPVSLLGGATLSTAQFQSGSASLFCNGTGGRALVAGTSPATIPAFPGGDIVLYVRPSTVADCVLAIQGDAAGYTWRLSVVSGKIVLTDNAMPSYTPVTITASSAPSLSVGTWTKITIRRSGNPADLTAGLINLLIDDVFAAYGNWNSISYGISTAGLTIGANYDGTSAFHGYIDAVTAETF